MESHRESGGIFVGTHSSDALVLILSEGFAHHKEGFALRKAVALVFFGL
jgi:hypothetical protein